MRYVTTRHRLGETFEPPAKGWVFHAATTAVECPPAEPYQVVLPPNWVVVVWRWRPPARLRPKPPPTTVPADPRVS